jgi:DNA-binding NarL/FixJ family response regulator
MSRIRVAVIDGRCTFADALASRLSAEPDMQLVAVSESADAARRLLNGRRVDIVLLDSGLMQRLDHLTADMPVSARLILLGAVPDAARIVEALRAGIAGWVAKEESTEQLLHVIRGVMRDETWVPATVVGPVLRLLLHGYRERGCSRAWPPRTSHPPASEKCLATWPKASAGGKSRSECSYPLRRCVATCRTC